MTVWRVYSEPYKADVALVVGGWNLLNILIAGCALGVVSERRESRQSRRVIVKRRCELLIGDRVIQGTIEDASVGGARVNVGGVKTSDIPIGENIGMRFKTNAALKEDILPISVRTVINSEQGPMLGCRYEPTRGAHYRLISDLVFSSSDQWMKFQASRRVNIGILRGTIWFVGISLYQTGRGLLYLMNSFRKEPEKPAPAVVAGKAGT
jgi:cellulose synthase (UDP-forming)